MKRRPGNPNWATGVARNVPTGPSEWEKLVTSLGFEGKPEMWIGSTKLRTFAKAKYKVLYVPEWFLLACDLPVEMD